MSDVPPSPNNNNNKILSLWACLECQWSLSHLSTRSRAAEPCILISYVLCSHISNTRHCQPSSQLQHYLPIMAMVCSFKMSHQLRLGPNWKVSCVSCNACHIVKLHARTMKKTCLDTSINKRPMGLDALLQNQLGHLPKFTYIPFPGGQNWAYFCSTGSGFRDFQNCHIWGWNLAIGQSAKSCTYTLFLPQGVEIDLFFLYGQRFPRYWPIFKIPIFGHETWPLAKVP